MKRVLVWAIPALLVLIGAGAWYSSAFLWLFVVLAPILVLMAWDLTQTRHSLLRNYPVFGHLRYLLEEFRHHIRQYFIEGDREEVPFSRVQRSVVYRRAKGVDDSVPFGKLMNVYEPGYEWLEHSMVPCEAPEGDPRVTSFSPSARPCSRPASIPTSLPSTAARAAPAPRRRSSCSPSAWGCATG